MNKMDVSGVLLSGEDLVLRGKLANETSLPEVGLKEVTPSGSWLEKKQVQSGLEERKRLLDAERIDKIGSLTHAVWRDNLKLAEVTQQVGGHWQYMGHHVDKTLYLAPEEALFLMETNCLLLKHNGVTVSLQKAYSLLLDEEFNLTQYKVYASLSRVGYKMFRHEKLQAKSVLKTENCTNNTVPATSETNKEQTNGSNSEIADSSLNVSIELTKETIATKDKIASSNETNVSIENSMAIDHNVPLPPENTTKNVKTVLSQETNDVVKMKDLSANVPTASDVDVPVNNVLTVALYTPKPELSALIVNDPKVPIPLHDSSFYLTVPDQETNVPIPETKEITTAVEDTNVPVAPSQMEVDENENFQQNINENHNGIEIFNSKATFSIDEQNVIRILNERFLVETAAETSTDPKIHRNGTDMKGDDLPRHILNYYNIKLQKISNRKIPSQNHPESIKEKFKQIPELCNKRKVTITSPNEEFLPRNVYLNQTSYVLDMEKVKNFTRRSSTPTNVTDRRNSVSSEPETPQIAHRTSNLIPTERYDPRYPNYFNNQRFQQPPRYHRPYFRPYHWRSFRYQVFNSPFQRFNYFSGSYPYLHRPNNNYINMARVPYSPNHNQPGPGTQSNIDYLNIIKNLADRVRHMRNPPIECLNSLHSVVKTYNEKFDIKIRVSRNYEIIEDTPVPSTSIIELDDDGPNSKKPRVDKYPKYLELIKKLAAKLKNLERKNQTSSKQKRALSNLIKNFNDAYDCDFYINSKGELIDRKIVVLDSSSDSDVAISSDAGTNKKKRRKTLLPNPFNILKRRRTNDRPGPSKGAEELLMDIIPGNKSMPVDNSEPTSLHENCSKEGILKYFEKNWLPSDGDFGKPMPCSKSEARLILSDSHEIYEFLNGVDRGLQNWQDLKLKFWTHMKYCAEVARKSRICYETADSVKPLISRVPENTPSDAVWGFLRIIPNNTDVAESSLRINFDVYNRDVQNFKKSKPPKPHFRIVCVEESSSFPSGAEVRGLHARCNDNTSIVFAVVGLGSISYLQVNPKSSIPCPMTDLDINGEAEACRQRKHGTASKH